MNRLGALCGLVIGIVLAQACGGGSTSKPTPASTDVEEPADPADNVAQAGPIVNIVIRMSKNDGQYDDEMVEAPCVGAAEIHRARSQRKQRIRWHVKQADYNKCPGLDVNAVEVRFDNAVLSLKDDGSDPAVKIVKAENGKINARVHVSNTTAPNSKQKYYIYYMEKKASPDPEMDINGDCGGCGPP